MRSLILLVMLFLPVIAFGQDIRIRQNAFGGFDVRENGKLTTTSRKNLQGGYTIQGDVRGYTRRTIDGGSQFRSFSPRQNTVSPRQNSFSQPRSGSQQNSFSSKQNSFSQQQNSSQQNSFSSRQSRSRQSSFTPQQQSSSLQNLFAPRQITPYRPR